MNDSLSNDTIPECQMTETMLAVKNVVYYMTYYILTPIFFILGMFGHSVCLLTFLRQNKNQSCNYQVWVTVSEILDLVTYFLYGVALEVWSGFREPGPKWFTSNYFLMWFSGYVSVGICSIFITSTLLLSVCMVLDRSLALTKPFYYKDLNHKRIRYAALFIVTVITLTTNVVDFLRYVVVPQDDIYIIISSEFKTSFTANALSSYRNATYVLGLLILIVCDYLMIRVFRQKAIRTKHLRAGVEGMKPEEKTLLIFTILQSALMAMGMTSLTFFFAMVYSVPVFVGCEGAIVLPIVDVLCQLSACADFYLLVLFSKRFRTMVWTAIRGRNRVAENNNTTSMIRSGLDNPTMQEIPVG